MDTNATFGKLLLGLQFALLIAFAVCATYSDNLGEAGGDGHILSHYGMFQDVHTMIFIGFGFLMTFLSKYGFSSVGYNFFIAAICIQLVQFTNGFWQRALHPEPGHLDWSTKLELDITDLIKGDFGAGAVLISFGAVLGKTSPTQLLVIAVLELVFYSLNETVGAHGMKAVDMGGSIFVHSFGAYFGLACSYILCRNKPAGNKGKLCTTSDAAKNGPNKTSDTFAMVGTIFLWMFWPSFNGALATGASQHRVVINTVIALCACCLTAFALSSIVGNGKLSMVHIQNATLAGGVAVGSSADLVIEPWGAVLIGMVAALVSTYGYRTVGPMLERRFGLTDTCGVHNLHGMPGIIGGIGGAISAATAATTAYGEGIEAVYPARDPALLDAARSASQQAWYQAGALGLTLVIAVCGGMITGWAAGLVEGNDEHFEDEQYWEVEGESDVEEGGEEMHAVVASA